jgi:hypothetical protein
MTVMKRGKVPQVVSGRGPQKGDRGTIIYVLPTALEAPKLRIAVTSLSNTSKTVLFGTENRKAFLKVALCRLLLSPLRGHGPDPARVPVVF